MGEGSKSGAAKDPSGASSALVASGRYRLFASLGRGGMADVYLGVAQGGMGFNRLVVVKRLREGNLQDGTFVSMFLDEGRLAARLNHPNVIHTYEIGEFEDTYFLAMEYLDGQSVSAISKALVGSEQKVDPAIWVKVISDALSGLHYAHELKDYDGTSMGVIHRDVSPQNLFITYDGRVKLVDFGIAKAALNSAQTETGVLKGKIAYMAPEQALGQTLDRRADIFPMGVVLWELIAGRRLIAGDAAAALHRLLNEPIRPLVDVVPGVDAELSAIVMKALVKDPAERYQTAAEMRAALEAWLRSKNLAIDEAQIGAFVSEMFKTRRVEVQKQIQAQMANLSSDPGAKHTLNFTSGTLPSLASGARSHPHSSSGGRGRVRAADESDVSAVKPATDGKGRRGLVTALVALAAVGALGAWVGVGRSGTASHAAAPLPTASIESKVSLTIVAAPPQATLYLDSKKLPGNPYVGSFVADGKEHEIRAEAPGFTPGTRMVRLESDATHEFALVAAAPPSTASVAAPEKPKPATVGAPPPRASAKTGGKAPAPLPSLEKDPW